MCMYVIVLVYLRLCLCERDLKRGGGRVGKEEGGWGGEVAINIDMK